MSSQKLVRLVPMAAVLVVLLALPLYISAFWLQIGLFAMAAAVGAIGINLLLGTAGQLSLGHSFFVAVGAYGYAFLAGQPSDTGQIRFHGASLNPVLAAVLAVILAGAAGALRQQISVEPPRGDNMKSPQRSKFRGVLAAAAVALLAHAAPAAAWEPTKPVEFIVPAGTGGGADQMARFIQGVVAKNNLMKQPIVVVNKSGGAGAEGFLEMKSSANDPHKIVITLSNLFTTPLGTGTPFNSQSVMRRPTPVAVWASSRARTPAACSADTTPAAASPTPSPSRTTTTMACTCASAGGIRRPRSSPWHMMSPPTMRVDVPHDVVQHSCWVPLASR